MRVNPMWSVLLCAALGCAGAQDGANCEEVCTRLTGLCGASLPGCSSACEANLTAAVRSCVVGAASCAEADACGRTQSTADAGAPPDAGSTQMHACDGKKYCSDSNTASVCQNNVTRSTPCNGKTCAEGRCGACTGDSDCRNVTYRCKCKDGVEKTGTVNAICGDSQGSQKWCSHPSISSSICNANGGGFDETFGYLATGCISSVDP